ncbi:hypothetical protein CROQUDRAFT_656846 [Cronartium quercuum f. sp. fusiforme G11]|uniref:1-(5-phosphoribosyl)-5-[(5-phosphoribosylamino)methylideneamino] imidazole-4-carboxamide isomerase n=1 Tax=Cronartium quercuum f. sp. fusiforme G11 TaxID=708437 RepID=A0A9P6TC14_9BASI|nr:hypothetical protein CROQUDRAFT_656846 [Cronartium quercuum f. sp. fusiforme G11]
MTVFRPCIDLHNGQVKQIVGGSLDLNDPDKLQTNFSSNQPVEYYTGLYQGHNLTGTHLIKLGPSNDETALRALNSWRGQIQLGGGVDLSNAEKWLDAGADKIIVTSFLFPGCKFSEERLRQIVELVGKEKLVIDLSCKKRDSSWFVASNQWRDLTDTEVNEETLRDLSNSCAEFLIHAADHEGLCKGIDTDLVKCLGKWSRVPVTYAGGANSVTDLDLVKRLSDSKVDLTFGSALDIFGGTKVKFEDLVHWNKTNC